MTPAWDVSRLWEGDGLAVLYLPSDTPEARLSLNTTRPSAQVAFEGMLIDFGFTHFGDDRSSSDKESISLRIERLAELSSCSGDSGEPPIIGGFSGRGISCGW